MGLRRMPGLGYINPLHHKQLFYSSQEGLSFMNSYVTKHTVQLIIGF